MQKVILILIVGILSWSIKAQEPEVHIDENFYIEIRMDRVMNDKGKILLGLYTREGFVTREPVQSGMAGISDGRSVYIFKNVPPGTYAVMALHDENENYRMDKQANGMPLEAWATSGDELLMGPPSFDAAKFTVKDKDLTLSLRF